MKGMVEYTGWKSTVLGVHTTRILVSVVAVLSFATGLLHMGMDTVSGPLGAVIPLWIQNLSGFTGALTGFVVLSVMIGLWGRYRAAWRVGVIVVPLTMVQAVLQASILSVPLILVAVLATVGLYNNRDAFGRSIGLTLTQKVSMGAVIGAVVYGTVGAYTLRHGFTQDLTLFDAFYYAIVTMSTVGYGDIAPVTLEARIFTVSLIVVGVGSFTAFVGSLIGPIIQHHLPKKVEGRRNKREQKRAE